MEHHFNGKKPKAPVWSREMKQFLKDNYHLMTLQELADYFGLEPSQVENQVRRQYLTKRGK